MLSSYQSSFITTKNEGTTLMNDDNDDDKCSSMELVFDTSTFMSMHQKEEGEGNNNTTNKMKNDISHLIQNYPTIPIENNHATIMNNNTITINFPIVSEEESEMIINSNDEDSNSFNNSNYIIFITPASSILQPISSITFTKIKLNNNNNNDEDNDDDDDDDDPRKLQCIKREFINKIILNNCITTIPNPFSYNTEKEKDEALLYYQVRLTFPTPSSSSSSSSKDTNLLLSLYRIYPSTKITLLQEKKTCLDTNIHHHQIDNDDNNENVMEKNETTNSLNDNKTIIANNIITSLGGNTSSINNDDAEDKLIETIKYIKQIRLNEEQPQNSNDENKVRIEKRHGMNDSDATTKDATYKEEGEEVVEVESQLQDTINYIQRNLLQISSNNNNNDANNNVTKNTKSNNLTKNNDTIPSSETKENDNGNNEAEYKIQTTINCIKKIRTYQKNENNNTKHKLDIPRTFLFHGPPGCGKTYTISKIIQKNSSNLKCISISGWCTKQTLHDTFNQILKYINEDIYNNIGLLFMDEFDSLCSSQDSSDNSILIDLSYYLDAINNSYTTSVDTKRKSCSLLSAYNNIILIAATNYMHSIPIYIRRSCRFDIEIVFTLPTIQERYDILYSLLLQYDNNDNSIEINKKDLWNIAQLCIGYVPADLVHLIRHASSSLSQQKVSTSHNITADNIKQSMKKIIPSTLRNKAAIIQPNISKSKHSIKGTINGAKEKLLSQSIEHPITKSQQYKKLNITIPKGILLYGPPGCGKTSLAKLAASSSNCAFLSLSPADVYASSYVGESERVIRNYFKIAKNMNSNCILFFDEIDSILGCSTSNDNDNGSGSSDFKSHRGNNIETRMLSTFLNEMDGVDDGGSGNSTSNKKQGNVLVLGATNRPNVLDLALLRPGRFDQILYIPPPDKDTRKELFQSYCDSSHNNNNDIIDLEYLASDNVSGNMTSAEIISICQEAAWIALREFRSINSSNDTSTIISSSSTDQMKGCESNDILNETKSITTTATNGDGIKISSDNNTNDFPKVQQRHIEEVLLQFVPLLVKEPKYIQYYESFASEFGR